MKAYGRMGMKIYTNESHDQHGRLAHIWKKPYKIFSRTNRSMTLNLSMWHCLCKFYQDCSNYDPGLTLTYFTPRSHMLFYGKSENYFLETIAVLGLKVA